LPSHSQSDSLFGYGDVVLHADVSHVGTSDEQLRQEFKAIVASGALENLEELMPVECLIASHHELFLQLLPGNQAR
jgi:hypothetical protein